MKRRLLAAGILFQAMVALGQVPEQPSLQPLTFEVASIKPSKAGPDHSGVTTEKGRIMMENVTLRRCIRSAYGVPEVQILGGPKWLDDDRYDINAKAEGPAEDPELMIMLQSLLAERFKLSFHREAKALPGYALVVGKSGLKAKPSAPDARGSTNSSKSSRKASIEAVACTMAGLAQTLSQSLHLPVADLTDTKGRFDFRLEWAPEDMQARPPGASDADVALGLSIFSALQEQLGLRLESRRVPGEVLVVDHAEPASEN